MRSVPRSLKMHVLPRRIDRDERQVRGRSLRSDVEVRQLRQRGPAPVHRQEPRRQGPVRRDREGDRFGVGGHRRRKGDPQPATRRHRLGLTGVDEPLGRHAVEPADERRRGRGSGGRRARHRARRRRGHHVGGGGQDQRDGEKRDRGRRQLTRVDAWRAIVMTLLVAFRSVDGSRRTLARWISRTCASSSSPNRARRTTTSSASRQPPNDSDSVPSSAATTTSRWEVSPVSRGRATHGPHSPASPGTRRRSASARSSRRPRSGSPVRSRSRWPVSTRCRTVGSSSASAPVGSRPSTARTASRSPTSGTRFDRLEEQLAIITGLWGTPEGRDVLVRRSAVRPRRLARAPEAGPGRRPADHRRRQGCPPDTRSWRRGTRRSSTSRSLPSRRSPSNAIA